MSDHHEPECPQVDKYTCRDCCCDVIRAVRADEREQAKAEVNAILDRGLAELRGANEFISPLWAALNICERTLGRFDRWAAARGEDTLLHANDCDRTLGCTCGTRTKIVHGEDKA